jgi:hypothetical protein
MFNEKIYVGDKPEDVEVRHLRLHSREIVTREEVYEKQDLIDMLEEMLGEFGPHNVEILGVRIEPDKVIFTVSQCIEGYKDDWETF